MHPRHKKLATSAAVALGALGMFAIAAAAFVRAGVYNIAADNPHYPLTYSMLEQLRDASIRSRAAKLTPPADLMSEARIKQGSGNYNAMCTGCHLAPGMEATEISKGLYPAPPNLSKVTIDASQAFWTIKHGIKASGMPAWGRSMGDEYVWNMAAFLQELPRLDADRYKEMVARSGGHHHDHGSGHDEDADHDSHEHGGEASHRDHGDEEKGAMAQSMPGASPPSRPAREAVVKAGTVHVHADGTQHVHKTQGARK